MAARSLLTNLCLVALVALPWSCRPRAAKSKVAGADDYPVSAPLSTLELHQYLKDRVAAQSQKAAVDDGANPNEDIWDYYIDPATVNKVRRLSIRNSRDFFGIPLSVLRLPAGAPLPDTCPEINRITEGGREKCLAMDNLMRYMWEPNGKGEMKTNPKDWFVHIIPQFMGRKQPALQRFIREGDIAVYFHPERRSDSPEEAIQWRATHAATIVQRELDGALMTADIPSGYAKPFNGSDNTPFHVFRFLPREVQDWQVADEYGRQIARWATLAFDKFEFQDDYGSMTAAIRSASDIDAFADKYIGSAMEGGGKLPDMYCAWYAWTNLNLAWMRPMSRAGLGQNRFESLKGKTFSQLTSSHRYGDGDFNKGYAVPDNLDSKMVQNPNFAITPLSAPELILGFVERIVGSVTPETTPQQFISMTKTKAALLAAMASEASEKFTSEPRVDGTQSIADGDTKSQADYNASVAKKFTEFAAQFDALSTKVSNGSLDVMSAQKTIQSAVVEAIKAEWTKNLRVSKKWIPPYGFIHHAEYGYENYNFDGRAQPVLVYVGTVVHESFLRKKGQPSGAKALRPLPDLTPSPEDLQLDKSIYSRLGCPASDDGKGWLALLSHLNPGSSTPVCGTPIAGLEKMNRKEYDAVSDMIELWTLTRPESERQIYIHNTFGLDPVIARRLLVSYWNDPTEHFKPAIYEGEASTVDSAVTNIRILLGDHSLVLNPEPAAKEKYDSQGHARRKTPMPCIPFAKTDIESCAKGPWIDVFPE